MNTILSNLYFDRYLNPVYSPIQISSFFSENCTGPIQFYSIRLFFDTPNLAAGNNYFIFNGVKFQISTTPTQNEIPDPSLYPSNREQFGFFVRQAIINNPIFDSYIVSIVFDNDFLFLTLRHKVAYTLERIVWSTDVPAYINLDGAEQIPDYCYSAQTLSNYSLWVDVFSNNNKNLFNWTDITGVTSNGQPNRLQSTLYKTYQPNNQYIFNIAPILQSVSRTTQPSLAFGANYFQQDTSSLNNLRLEFSESYDVEFGGVTTIRKFPMLVNGFDAIENRWYWDAARNLTQNEIFPYYLINASYIVLSGVEINGRTQLLFKYQLDIDETISLEDAFQTIVFTASTFNDGDKIFKVETQLSGTVENFVTVLLNYFTSYNVSYTGYGYSQVFLDINNSFYDTALDLITTGSSNGHIVRTDFLSSRTENQISLDFPPEEGINTQTEIKFLTDRPRQDTSLRYNLAQFSSTGLTYKNNTLSLFISPIEAYVSAATGSAVIQQGFFVRIKYYENGQWSDTWTDSNPEPWAWNSGTDQGTENGLYHVDLDPLRWGTTTSTEKIKYAIGWYMKDTDDISYIRNYSEIFEYNIDLVCDYQIVKQFMFLNDLGGWDYYDFIEDLTTQYNRDETLISTDASGLIEINTTYQQMFQNSIEQSFKVRTIVNSQAEYDWLYQLIKSSRVFFIETNNTTGLVDNYYQQVIITNSDFQQTENTNQWVLNIDYRIAKKDVSQKSI
jgi:hypothetical protein